MKFYIYVKLCMKTIKSYNYIISVINRFLLFTFTYKCPLHEHTFLPNH